MCVAVIVLSAVVVVAHLNVYLFVLIVFVMGIHNVMRRLHNVQTANNLVVASSPPIFLPLCEEKRKGEKKEWRKNSQEKEKK